MRIQDDTLSLTLKENNEVVIGAKIYTEVSAKTWIWKGINFGLLGCLKISSCSGQIATYSANIDTKVSFKALWNKTTEKLSINVKPVETRLDNVNVAVRQESLNMLRNVFFTIKIYVSLTISNIKFN